jgi:hypothetical protein
MPFSLIPAVLGVCFVLVWLFIGGMILRDGQFAVRRERELRTNNPSSAAVQTPSLRPYQRFGFGRKRAAMNAKPLTI